MENLSRGFIIQDRREVDLLLAERNKKKEMKATFLKCPAENNLFFDGELVGLMERNTSSEIL